MRFPDKKYNNIGEYLRAYTNRLEDALKGVDLDKLQAAASCIKNTIKDRHTIFFCGNGGSAAIANHFICDFVKGLSNDNKFKPNVYSLNSSVELYSAIANDISFENVFSYQLERFAKKDDLLVSISSSGDSQNIINSIQSAKMLGCKTIAMSGFTGGRSTLADIHINIEANNYGIVEDCHHALLHIIAQFIRFDNYDSNQISSIIF